MDKEKIKIIKKDAPKRIRPEVTAKLLRDEAAAITKRLREIDRHLRPCNTFRCFHCGSEKRAIQRGLNK